MSTQWKGNAHQSRVPLRTHRQTEEQVSTRYRQRRAPEAADEEEENPDAWREERLPSSAVRWRDTQGNQVIQQGNRRMVIHDAPPPGERRPHWLLIIGIGMMLMLFMWVGWSWLTVWWTEHQLDASYGFPRTYQTDAVVYSGDSAEHPSHYIFLNLNGTVIVIELPHGDAAHARIYKGPTLFSDNAGLIPVTGEFRQVNGKEEMLIHIQGQTIIYINDGTQFRPQG